MLFPDEIQLGRSYIRMTGEFADFVELGSVLDRVIEGGFAEGVNTDASGAEAVVWDSGGNAVAFNDSPDGFAGEGEWKQGFVIGCGAAEQEAFAVGGDAGGVHVVED